MKKTLIALAVAGVAVSAAPVAMADAGAYGRVTTALTIQDDNDDSLSVDSGSSRFAVNSDRANIGGTDNRLSYAGVKGGFGEITIGRHWAPFYEQVVGRTDTFQAVGGSAPIIGGAVTSTDTANDARGPSIRTSDTIKYTNSFGGITVSAMAQMRDNADGDITVAGVQPDDEDIDRIDISVSGQAGAIGWGVGVVSDAVSQGDDTTSGIGADFAVNKDLKIVGAVVMLDNDAIPNTETAFSIGAIMQLGGGMQVQARFSDVEEVATQFDVGFEKKFSNRTRLFAELENNEPEVGDGTNVISLGVRHDF